MKRVVNVRKINVKYKSFLIFTKILPHISAFMYIIYTILLLNNIDFIILGYLLDYSIIPWTYIYVNSFIFKFCYVHRLPLYYILTNEFLTTADYYINIPINDYNLLLIHIFLIGILIFGYSFYYIKFKLLSER